MANSYILAAVLAVLGTVLIWQLYRNLQDARLRRERRANYLDGLKPLFSGGLKAIKPDGFARLSGSYEGHTFDLQVLEDSLSMRKLPALWLLVTLPEPMPVAATFDMMMRPRGVEPFSKFSQLPVQIQTDAGFPHDCAVRTDDAARLPPRDLIARHLGLFADPRAKELLISPKGLRIVWLAEEAHRGKYLIFRDGEMGRHPPPPTEVKAMLDYLLKLRADLDATSRETAA